MALPGQDEEHSAVFGLGNQQAGVGRGEAGVEDDVDARGCLEDGGGLRFVHLADAVDEGAGGVDHAAGPEFEFLAAEDVANPCGAYFPVLLFESDDFDVRGNRRAVLFGGERQADGHAGVVELAVVIDDAGLEALGLEHGETAQRFFAADEFAAAEPEVTGEQVVHDEAGVDVRDFEPVVDRRDQRQTVCQVRGVLEENATFMQGFLDQMILGAVEVLDRRLEVTHAAMHELGALAACAFREVVLFQQGDLQASAGGIEGNAATGCATADDQQVVEGRCAQGGAGR